MDSIKTKPENESMSDPDEEDGRESERQIERRGDATPASSSAVGPGYFHIYKKGQGYWTRMGTVAGAGLLGLLTGNFIYTQCQRFLTVGALANFMTRIHLQDPRGAYLVVAIFAIAYSIFAFHIMNKPGNADFLIATDSEMKKVNWTTQKELTTSTKIVILFVFVMAVVLFCYDLFFQLLFYLLGVLKTPPFFMGH